VIILDYIALVYLVASVDTEQQAQSRSTYHVQKTTNATEINNENYWKLWIRGLVYPATEDIKVTESY